MACIHIQYTGGISPFSSGDNVYHCDLCGKTWDWGDPHIDQVCKNGEAYRQCPSGKNIRIDI